MAAGVVGEERSTPRAEEAAAVLEAQTARVLRLEGGDVHVLGEEADRRYLKGGRGVAREERRGWGG